MYDLSIELYAVCRPYAEWGQASPKERKMMKMKTPKCKWNQYNEGGVPFKRDGENICPECGGPIEMIKYAV
jgi:hypothetical protein